MNDAGRIGFVLKGDFVLSQPYEFLDVVKDHNATYVAKENTINEPTSNTQKWQCIMDADVEGLVHVCTVNPSGTQFSSNWLMEDGAVITPEPEDLYRVVFGGKERLFFWNSVDNNYEMISGGGHTIISSSLLPMGGSIAPMAGRDNLQFGSEYDPIFTEDDPTNNKTIVHGQMFICDSESDWKTLSDAAFKAKYGADREQVGVYWYLPWANSIAYQTDLTPVGTVLSLAVDTTRLPADLVEFPNKDYVICRGATVKITDYPALYQYFEDEYGDGNYFGTAQTAEGYFVLPNWSADFPTNGVLVIKARVTSDVITFAEVDDEAVTAENVWSAKKVSDYLYDMRRRVRKNITSEIQEDNGARLIAAIAEQDLAKYGFAIGDYFESPTTRTLKQQSSNASTETDTSVKLRYHLADMNTYYGGYSSYSVVSTPHIGIVVDTMVTRQWHTGDATSVGYNGSTLQAFLQGTSTGQVMTAIKADMITLFGGSTGLEHLISHQKMLTNAFANWAWQPDKYISALTESEIFGHTEWSGNTYQEGEAVKPLELFRKFRWNEIFGNNWIWLRNLSTATSACFADRNGLLNSGSVAWAGWAAGIILFH